MKLHEFTSAYEITLVQSPSDGTYFASVFKDGDKSPVKETDNYEDWADAMEAAVFYVEQEGNIERDEALTERYCDRDEKPDRWGHPDE